MLIPFWFRTSRGLGYGVTASSQAEAEQLLQGFGYPRPGETVVEIVPGIKHGEVDQQHVIPNAGPMIVRGVWYPKHNL